MKYYIYILRAHDGSHYTGITKDLQERLGRHKSGRGAKFTKNSRTIESGLLWRKRRFEVSNEKGKTSKGLLST